MPSALFVNDYSFHGQFASPAEVVSAVRRLRSLHAVCREYSIECYCSRVLLGSRAAMRDTSLREAVLRHPSADARRLVLSWLDRHGPHWDPTRLHDAGDWYFALQGDMETLVTDSAVAECAARVLLEQNRSGLLSATPSDFMFTPVKAGILNDAGEPDATCELPNHWEEPQLRQFLRSAVSVSSWEELRDYATHRFAGLLFTPDAFAPIMPSPFSVGLRDRIITLLDVLNRISAEVDARTGALSSAGEALRQEFFVGKKALFSDSSDPEKRSFKTGLTFVCPIRGKQEFFPWHGKAKMGAQYRIHFGWPKPDYAKGIPVVYVGPKITIR